MKKIIMSVVALAVATTMNAQVYVGGSLGFSSSNDKTEASVNNVTVTEETKTTSFEILPEIGYKLNDNMAVGTVIGLTYSNIDYPTEENISHSLKGTYFNFKPYFRYYFAQWDKVSLFADAQIGFVTGKATEERSGNGVTVSSDVKSTEYSFAVVPGIAYQPTEKISIVAKLGKGLGYWHTKDTTPTDNGNGGTYDVDVINNEFGLNLKSLGLTVGVYYNF